MSPLQCGADMTATAPLPTTSTGSLPTAGPPGRSSAGPARGEQRHGLVRTDTPGQMRMWSIAAAIVAALFGIIGSGVVADRSADLATARDSAAQLERLESVRTAVVEADSLASSAYLEGGLESPERRSTYEDRLNNAQSGLVSAAASAASTDESDRLGNVGSALTAAGGLVEQARANSRQGFPVGAAYQRNASALIRSDVLPVLDSLATAAADRSADEVEHSVSGQVIIWISAAVALAVLFAASRWLLRRTRRVVNIGVGAAALLVLGITAFASIVMASSSNSAASTLNGPYAGATAFAQARTAAFDAKSNEALTLIARGNGARFEDRWQQLAAQATNRLMSAADSGYSNGPRARDAFADYVAQHVKIRGLDDGGQYDEAVKQALAAGSANDGFARFDQASGAGLETLSAQTNDALTSAGADIGDLRWVVLIGGLVAAAAAFGGFARRIQEYR